MKQSERRLLCVALLLLDAITVTLALVLAYYIRIGSGWIPYLSEVDFGAYERSLWVAVPLWLAIAASMRLYHPQLLLGGPQEYAQVFKACSFSVLALVIINFASRDLLLSRGLLIIAWGLSIVMMVSGRFVFRRLVYYLRSRGHFQTRTLIVGASQHTRGVVQQLQSSVQSGVTVVGFLDDYLPFGTYVTDGLRVLGTPSDLTEVVREQQVQEVIIFPESLSWESFQETMRDTIAAIPGVEIKVSPGFYEILATDVTVAHKAFVPLFTLRGLRITGADAVIKTLLDYTVALALTIVFAPLTALIALVLWLRRDGPVFDRPEVMGLRGQTFRTFKFHTGLSTQVRRTLTGPLPDDVPALANAGKLARYLFSTRLDKLPQLWDVLRGKMSLVGPRTISCDQTERYGVWLPSLLTVKPGLTGPWAVDGSASLDDEIRLLLYYVRNWTIWFDLQVLFQTARGLLRRPHAAMPVAATSSQPRAAGGKP